MVSFVRRLTVCCVLHSASVQLYGVVLDVLPWSVGSLPDCVVLGLVMDIGQLCVYH